MSTKERILREIEDYIARAGISAREFGLRVRGDSGMVYRLRAGRSLTVEYVDKCRDYMAANPPPTPKKRAPDRAVVA